MKTFLDENFKASFQLCPKQYTISNRAHYMIEIFQRLNFVCCHFDVFHSFLFRSVEFILTAIEDVHCSVNIVHFSDGDSFIVSFVCLLMVTFVHFSSKLSCGFQGKGSTVAD